MNAAFLQSRLQVAEFFLVAICDTRTVVLVSASNILYTV